MADWKRGCKLIMWKIKIYLEKKNPERKHSVLFLESQLKKAARIRAMASMCSDCLSVSLKQFFEYTIEKNYKKYTKWNKDSHLLCKQHIMFRPVLKLTKLFFFKLVSFFRRSVMKESERKLELKHFCQSLYNMQMRKQILMAKKKSKTKIFFI